MTGTRLNRIPGGPKTPVRSSVAAPNSTVDTMRAQFRPRPFSRAIHSHSASGTKDQAIDTVMNGVFRPRAVPEHSWRP